MKVWIINHYAIPPSYGGLVRHYYFSKYLTEKGHTVKIFTSSKIHNSDVNMISDNSLYLEKNMDGVEYTFVRNSDYKGNGFDRIVNMLQFPLRIWRVCKKFEKPDVIYTSSPDLFTALSAVLLARHLKVKKVVEVRDLWPESIVAYTGKSKKNPVMRVLYMLEKWLYKKADELIFTMEGAYDYIVEQGWEKSVPKKKVHHVCNGVDLEEFHMNLEKYQVQDEDLEDSQTYKIIYMGSLRKANDQIYRVFDVASAMAKDDKYKNVRIFVYGKGDLFPELQERSKTLPNVMLKGFVEKKYVPYILSKCNLNILNLKGNGVLKYGGSQNKLFEYLASGNPVISGEISPYSTVNKYGCGISREFETTEEILKAIDELRTKAIDSEHIQSIAGEYDFSELTSKLIRILEG